MYAFIHSPSPAPLFCTGHLLGVVHATLKELNEASVLTEWEVLTRQWKT